LYDWETAQRATPEGWRLPSYDEWAKLIKKVGGAKIAGKVLKSTQGWASHDGISGNGTDIYGFSALPGGLRNKIDQEFGCVTREGCWWSRSEYEWWSRTEQSDKMGYCVRMDRYKGGNSVRTWDYYPKGAGMSVRCILNE